MEREEPLGHLPGRPPEATPLTSFGSWKARDHLREGGLSALVLPGWLGPWGGGQSLPVHKFYLLRKGDPAFRASAASWLSSHPFWSGFGGG